MKQFAIARHKILSKDYMKSPNRSLKGANLRKAVPRSSGPETSRRAEQLLWKGKHWRTHVAMSLVWCSSLLGLQAAVAQSGDDAPLPEEIAEAARGVAGSPYIPIDSWIYPAALRLHDLGDLPTLYLGMRPFTRVSLAHMLLLTEPVMRRGEGSEEATELYLRLRREFAGELSLPSPDQAVVESAYVRVRGIHGPVLNDSFHFGQTITNDYGRPYQPGFNAIAGVSGWATMGRFNLYTRYEVQHAPAGTGYSDAVAHTLEQNDELPVGPRYFNIPQGAIASQTSVRLLEANLSAHVAGHQISFGRSDSWLGPAQGASMIWSNNAEPIYAFRINRIEPLYIPGISRLTGLFRYEFFVGSLKGHNVPSDPWIHLEKISFKPTADVEFGFARSVIWGGEGHVPITLGTFFRSFFSAAGVQPNVKFSREDPGARFSSVDATWRIPFDRYRFTLYTDSFAHDDVFPISNPPRAGIRPGLLITRLPGLSRVDLRVEAASTDPPVPNSQNGNFLLFESVQKQGYTNRSFLLGDAIGRENKGGNAWLTWHRSPETLLQLEYRSVKAAKDFLPGGTTQQDLTLNARLRPLRELEVTGSLQGELGRAPLLHSGTTHTVVGTVQVTWFPHRAVTLRPLR